MNIAMYIDHTILKPDVKKEEIIQYCKDAKTYGFFSVCVNGSNVAIVADQLKGSDVKVTAVVGFPLGASTMEVKAFETSNAIDNGANEIDMVINIGALKSKEYDLVYKDIEAVVNAAKSKAIVKVIIETSLLTDEEKVKVCELAKQAGADFVKTSTGFSTGGATAEDVKLMKETVGENVQVKASGGVRDYKTAITMIEAGATRIGCSASISIVKGIEDQQGGY